MKYRKLNKIIHACIECPYIEIGFGRPNFCKLETRELEGIQIGPRKDGGCLSGGIWQCVAEFCPLPFCDEEIEK